MLVLALGACSPKRPANLPQDAVFVLAAKGGYWQRCTFVSAGHTARCQIFNIGGETLYDDTFASYDGHAIDASELRIAQYDKPPHSGPDRICLSNGRVLVPQSEMERLRSFFEPYRGKPCE
jgi:hypothetical protein